MSFTMPRYADADDVIDRALRDTAKDIPVSLANLLPALRWKLSGLNLTQGSDNYSGEGATQADGRLVLDLFVAGRQVTYQ